VGKSGSVDHHKLGICTALSRGAKDLIAHFESCHSFTHGSHSAGDIAPRCPWKLQWEDVAQETETAPWIDPIQAGEVVLYQHLSGTGSRNRNLVEMERCSIVIDA
jgi:hypothetical protein